jgi:hypothetical protein
MNHILSKSNLLYVSLFMIFLSYYGYRSYKNNDIIEVNTNNEVKEEKPRITSKDIDKYIQKEFSKVLKIFAKEAQNTAKSMSEFNHDFLLKSDYLNFRNSLFTKDIEKTHLLIDSKNITHTSSHNTSNYTITLYGNSDSTNETGGYGRLLNVIGFRLIKATIPSNPYHITGNNNKILINYNDTDYTITLVNGNYTSDRIASQLQTTLNDHASMTGFTVTFNETGALKYKFVNSSTNFYFKWNTNFKTNDSSIYRVLGFLNKDQSSAALTQLSEHAPDISTHFIDVVMPDIPYIACKKNASGKNVIDRIPIHTSAGGIIHYQPPPSEYFSQNYFYPISLSKLTIELYEDSSNKFYETQNIDNYFEFEITTVKNTKNFNK